MKKMPCLFQRDFNDPRRPVLLDAVTPGCEWVLDGVGTASVKRDGTACMVRGGVLFARYDSKLDKRTGQRKVPPPAWEPCDDAPDAVTGHWPGWVPVDTDPKLYKHHAAAYAAHGPLPDGTYELCGPHFNGNPEGLEVDAFIAHGSETDTLMCALSFAGLRAHLECLPHEGLVFLHPDGRRCKIRRDDYGLDWPIKAAP